MQSRRQQELSNYDICKSSIPPHFIPDVDNVIVPLTREQLTKKQNYEIHTSNALWTSFVGDGNC